MTRIRATRRCPALLAAAWMLLVVLSGCGGGAPPGSSGEQHDSSSGESDPVRVRYTATSLVDGEKHRQEYEVIADAYRRFRVTFTANDSEDPPAGSRIVWDGKALLEYFPNSDPPYNRTEDPGQDQRPSFAFKPGTDEFSTLCPSAKHVGTDTIVGRVALHYDCGRIQNPDGSGQDAHQVWIDEATGLLLKDSGEGFTTVATEFTPNPAIDENTFSTTLPTGAEDAAHPRVDGFRLPRVGGGEVAFDDYRGQPLIIVAGPATGVRQLVTRLLPMTGGGAKPRLLGMLIVVPPEDWKGSLTNPEDAKSFSDSVSKSAGTFKVPVGIDIKGAASYSFTRLVPEIQPGQPDHLVRTAVALIRSDDTVERVATDTTATDTQLQTWIAALA
jgi:outer membrane lipoprotein-sorting protein